VAFHFAKLLVKLSASKSSFALKGVVTGSRMPSKLIGMVGVKDYNEQLEREAIRSREPAV
jgi:hypothetical protein